MFTWDTAKALSNFEKHGVSFEEGATIFTDTSSLDWEDLLHSFAEPRRKRVGKSANGRILMLIYTVRRLGDGKETIRIISTRQASRDERQAYSRQ